MQVNLIGVTKPRVMTQEFLPKEMTAEQFIAYCARVSNPSNQNNTATADKLLGYMVRNKHWSPFEMVSIVMEIKTTRDIGRQILRHRSFSFQEFSQRYAAVVDMSPPRETRFKDDRNRQNSITYEDYMKEPDGDGMTASILHEDFQAAQKAVIETVVPIYEELIKRGLAKEQARVLLPEGLTMSHMYMSGSLRSWIHYCELRTGNGTQKEHREIAQECWKQILVEFPSLSGILEQNKE